MTDTRSDDGSAPSQARVRVQDEHGFDARRRVSATLVLAVFGIALLLPWVVGRGLKTGESDAPAEFPNLSLSTVVDDSAFRQVDAAIKDRLPFKAIAVRAVGLVGTRLLHRSMTPLVVMSPGEPPFLAEDFTSCTPFDASSVKKNLDEFAARVDAAGKSMAVFVAPDKSTVLRSDLGPKADALLACADPIRTATQDTWPGTTGVVVPLFQAMSAAEQAHPGSTYQYGDSHWLPAGARVFSAAVVQWLSVHGELPSGAWAPNAVVVGPATNKGGDLFRLMGSPRTDVVHDEKSVRPGVTTTMQTRHGSGAETYEFRSVSNGPALVPGHTIVVRDSFFSRAMPQLAPYFEHLTVMHWAEFMKEAPAGALPRADHYIFETVQRGWSARASRVLASPRYMKGVEKSLGMR